MGLSDEIQTQIDHTLQQLPTSQQGTIRKVYSDPTFVDIQLDAGIVNYVKCIGTAEVGAEAVLLFLNNSHNEYIVITQTNIDENMLERIIEEVIGDEIDLSNYYTITEINGILSSYATIGYLNTNFARAIHTHSQYITRGEISDLDINLTTLELVPFEDNENGVICFDRVQKTIDELDIDLKADTLSNGYLKIEVDLIEVTRSVNDGNNS